MGQSITMVTCSFKDGVWKAVSQKDRCTDVFVDRKKKLGTEFVRQKLARMLSFQTLRRKFKQESSFNWIYV